MLTLSALWYCWLMPVSFSEQFYSLTRLEELWLSCVICVFVFDTVSLSVKLTNRCHTTCWHILTQCVCCQCVQQGQSVSQLRETDESMRQTRPLSGEDESVSFSALNLWCRLFSWLYWKQWCNKQSEARAWSRRSLIVLRSDHLQNQEIQSLYF